MKIKELLRNVPFFAKLNDQQLDHLTNIGTYKKYLADQVVFHAGDKSNELYIIIKGDVKVYRTEAEKLQVNITRLSVGNYFGEIALIDGRPRSATVKTLTPSEFFIIDRNTFLKLVADTPRLLSDLLVSVSSIIRHSNEEYYALALQKERISAQAEIERHKSIAQMVAGVAHEMNTPLGIIHNAATIMTELLASKEILSIAENKPVQSVFRDIQDAIKLILKNIDKTNHLVTSFKNLSVKQITDVRESTDITTLIEEAINLYRMQSRKSKLEIKINCELDEQERMWDGYPSYFFQVILNLFSNTEKHAYGENTPGQIDITVTKERSNNEKSFLITVRDYGQGITEENLPKVFNPFFTTGRSKGSTGLGLAIVHNIVTSVLKGKIDMKSKIGKGTTVDLYLPLSV